MVNNNNNSNNSNNNKKIMKGKRMVATNTVNTFIKIISFDQNTKSLTLSVPQLKFVPYIVTQLIECLSHGLD